MSRGSLLDRLRAAGIRVRAVDGELEVDAPPGVLTPELRAELRAEKPNLLKLLAWSRRAAGTAAPLEPVKRTGPLPLSWAQQRLWFLDQLEPGTAAYNLSWTVRLRGDLDTRALRRAWQQLVDRHESLRTVFPDAGGVPEQRVLDSLTPDVGFHDLRGAFDEQVRAELQVLAGRSFDLAKGPLHELVLLRLGEREHMLLVVVHHIVADGASMRILFRELAACYEAELSGEPADLPPLPVQYVDFAVWQRSWLDGAELARQTDYWRGQLAGLPPLLELPWDRPRSAAMRYRGASFLQHVPPDLAAELRRVSREQGCTLFMTMLAAFYVLLWRYSGRDDLVVGTPLGGRSRTSLEGLIGFFVNTVVLRARLDTAGDFAGLLQQVRDTALAAHANQDLPFERLVEVLQPQRELSYTPVFQVMFDLQEEPRWKLPVQQLEVIPEVVFSSRTSSFDLTLSVRQAETGLDAMFEYDTDLFDAASIERMADQYVTLLNGIVLDTRRPLTALNLLDPLNARRQVRQWQAVSAPYAADRGLHELVAEVAAATPDASAVTCGADTWSYAELLRYSATVAAELAADGVCAGMTVGVLAQRTAHTVGTFLGILRIGAAVVPLDPAYPVGRLRDMLSDAGAARLLHGAGDADLAASVTAGGLPVHSLPTRPALTAELPAVAANSQAAAFIMFTSGSSGRPKGVVLPHSGLVNYVTQLGRQTDLRPHDRLLQFASFSFDIALEECFAALLHGATLVLRDATMTQSLQAFVAGCDTAAISWMSLPTAWWHELCAGLQRGDVQCPATLRWLVVGGEKADPDALRQWRAAAPEVRILNTYGPTEASIAAAWCELTYLDVEQLGDVPLGLPVPNVRIWVLDSRQQLLPRGLPGEICIGGVGLAEAYRGAAELTAERFPIIELPDGSRERLYRTGDRGRYDNAGQLRFLGRMDAQLKVRGHRIEPGEIESALSMLAGVERCAVVPHGHGAGTLLVAYVTGSVQARRLRAALQQRLPEYMLPAEFIVLPQLPFTPNGKLDRTALPAPSGTGRSAAVYRAPVTPTERMLSAIWAEVLQIERVGVDDDFFALGGHSLIATRVMARVREALAVEVPLRALFDEPTVAGLAARIDSLAATGAADEGIVPRPGSSEFLPLSAAQRRLWMLQQLEPDSTAYHLYTVARLRGPLSVDHLEQALCRLVERHEALRTVFAEYRGEPVQRVVASQPVELGRERVSAELLAQPEPRLTALIDTPFDLARGPLLRAHLLQGAAGDEAILLLVMHHIVSDGWSVSVAYRDLSAFYNAACGKARAPAALAVQYPDYALWQRDRQSTAGAAALEAYWQSQLADAPPVLELPADKPRPAARSFSGAWESRLLPADLHAALQDLAERRGVSLFMVLLTGFNALLYRHTGRTDLLVGTPVAGRTHQALEPLVGCFLNTLVLRTRCGGQPTFSELLAQVRETTLAAYEHQGLPFERLLELLQPPRTAAWTPVVQVLFNLHNERGEGLQLHDVSASAVQLGRAAAKFDLSVSLTASAEGLRCGFEYSTDLFAAATAETLLEHYQQLLTALVTVPDQAVAAVPLAAVEQRWTPADADAVFAPAAWANVAERFAAVVERHGARPAVLIGDAAVSYTELGGRVAAVAEALRQAGTETGEPVGLLLAHDVDMLSGLLGTLMAGCAYVPLDRHAPVARSRAIAAQAGIRCLVHSAALDQQATQLGNGELQQVPVPAAAVPAAAVLPRCDSAPDDPAYILFTSGSTGTPKGVLQSQRNLLRHAATYAAALRLQPADVLTLLPGYGFDAAVMDIFGALLTGAALRPVDLLSLAGPQAALDQLTGATVWHCTPTVWRYLLGSRAAGAPLTDVRAVVLGGEEARSRDFDLFRQHCRRGAIFVNGYGPTESTLATQFFADHATVLPGGRVPIGVPVAHTEVELLDGSVPAGVTGEVVIRSTGLSQGYLGDPDATAARFAVLDAATGLRQYRTGDRARRLPDGQLVFAGRLDAQLKVRGYRIEPGEIEACAGSVAGVSRCAVLLREEQLVCFFSGAADVERVRRQLAAQLPIYMLPHNYVRLETLPLRANGKVDRDTLAALAVLPAAEREPAAPADAVEALVADVWRDVLGRAEVGRDDDFFALGGHSLLATQVIARLRDHGYQLGLRDLFSATTLSEFAGQLRNAGGVVDQMPLRRRADDARVPPLSWAQQRLWFLAQLEPESAAYHLHWAGRMTAVPDAGLLTTALREVARRHESLRTCIRTHRDGPLQIVVPETELQLQQVALPGADPSSLQSRMRELIRRPFDLERAPLLRAWLLELGPADSVLLLVMHHIVSDGWSMGVLFRELSEIYSALAAGRRPELPELPVQYADYAVWQQQWMRGAELERQAAYWREQLRDAPSLLELPLDQPRPPVQRDRGAWLNTQLSADLLSTLQRLAAEQGATLFMLLLAGFKSLLLRYTGQRDLLVGVPVAGRGRTELEGLIGYFLNMLVVRSKVDPDAGFTELLEQVRERTLEAYDHQELPFEKLLEVCRPARSLAHTPLVQVSFNLHNEPGGRLRLGDIATEVLTLDRGTTKFDLSMSIVETRAGLQVGIEYNTDLFAAATVRALLQHYEELLRGIAREPDQPLAGIPLMPAAPALRLPPPAEPFASALTASTVTRRFAALAGTRARQPAVRFGEQTTTYAELLNRSSAIASELLALHLEAGALIGVMLDHDADMAAALLGVMQAGHAYLPLDAGAPLPRLRQLVAEAQPDVVLTAGGHAARAQALRRPVLNLAELPAEVPHPVPDRSRADGLAYVLLTSGSTGTPKGVMQTHRNVLHHVGTYADALRVTAADRMTLFSAYGFDAAVMDIFGALLTGACLYPLDIRDEAYPGQTLDVISTQRLTLLHATPTVYRYLMRSRVCRHELDTVRAVVLGGEQVTGNDFELFRKQFAAGTMLVNGLGPSESTLTAQFFADHDTRLPGGAVPIGKAVRDTELLLLDADGRETGLEGELAIRSRYVAVGYWRQAALTAERFSPDPERPGITLYRTGDRVRRLPDGNLVFVGRTDDQLKVRGHRVEAGDIEAALTSLSGIQRAAVVLREEPARLTAYVVGTGTPAERRRELRDCLPRYMVPDAIVFLEALPLTANGKLDRAALPEPRLDLTVTDTFVAPRNELEERLVALWSDILGLDGVGVHDDFFEVGGHSLLAAQLAGRIHESLQVVIPLRRLFDAPTIAQQAEYLDTLRWTVEGSHVR